MTPTDAEIKMKPESAAFTIALREQAYAGFISATRAMAAIRKVMWGIASIPPWRYVYKVRLPLVPY